MKRSQPKKELSHRVFLREEVVFDDWTEENLEFFIFLVRRLPPSEGLYDRELAMLVEDFYPYFGREVSVKEILQNVMSFSRNGIAYLRTYYDEIKKFEYTERDGYTVVSAYFVDTVENKVTGEKKEQIRLTFLGLLSSVYDMVRAKLPKDDGMGRLFSDSQMIFLNKGNAYSLSADS